MDTKDAGVEKKESIEKKAVEANEMKRLIHKYV